MTDSADREHSSFPRLDAAGGLVHVWVADLDDPRFHAGPFDRLLSADEHARAARLRFDIHRQRFTTGRALLRILLGSYLNRAPGSIRFEYGASGKPRLQQARDSLPIEFNIAHSDACALFAFTRGSELGVDVEQLRPVREFDEIAQRFFSPAEADLVCGTPDPARVGAFYRCWTRKEAFIKALGDGLFRPLDSFAVSIDADREPRIEWALGETDPANSWSLHHIAPRDGFVGALAVPRRVLSVLQLELRPDLACVREVANAG